ncbi:hypothetical protein H8N03_12135 [Ramlibacter sp. USB13]|uniref:Uncharacterized protein n=1 Tax=Ramlibacter cellulosilyticus TaxID=2764187 RepID=A0A923MTX4_9BURK|nr:hypothetical protein [Ramlibacter cellulosilyticus]MBC5783697.1 hypothetical protein [Ramlibacter cellulosilyticus]
MPTTRRALACCLALACIAPSAFAVGAGQTLGNPSALGDERNVALRLTATGAVTAVDPELRLMAVDTPRGSITFRLDPRVQDAEAIQVGSRVQVDYVAAFVLSRRGSGRALRSTPQRSGAPADLVGSYDRPITYVTDVLAVDKDNLVLRLRGPEGDVKDFPVHDRAALAGMRAGDKLLVSMNQAVAVGVTAVPR